MESKETLRGAGLYWDAENLDWGYGRAITTWEGVTVSGTPQRVTRVELQQRALTGTLSSSLGNLSNLEILNLYANRLSGSIPPELGNVSNLEDLNLPGSELSGSIPPELGNLSNLQSHDL